MAEAILVWDVFHQLDVVALVEGDIANSVPLRRTSPVYRHQYKHSRSRKVWIKARPLEGLPKGNDTSSDLYSNKSWLHWALEAGPWTIEVVLEGKKLSQITVRRTHHSACHDEWEDEVDRVCVGETTMSDEHIDVVREHIAQTAQTYELQSMNCQTVAATLAVLICDDGFETWDSLESMHFFNIQSLFVPLIHLHYNYETHWAEPRMFRRGKNIAMTLRKQMRAGRSEEDGSVRDAAISNSLIGNLHTWYALINGSAKRDTNRKEARRKEAEKEGARYTIGRLMDMVSGFSELVKQAY